MTFARGIQFADALGKALCEQWGINPSECFAIHIDIEPHDVRAYVHLAMNEGTVREILNIGSANVYREPTRVIHPQDIKSTNG